MRDGCGSDASLFLLWIQELASYQHELPRAEKLTSMLKIRLWREDHGEKKGTVIFTTVLYGRVLVYFAASPENW